MVDAVPVNAAISWGLRMMAVRCAMLDNKSGPDRSGRMMMWFCFHGSNLDDTLRLRLKHGVLSLKLERGGGMVGLGLAFGSVSDLEGLTVL